MRKTIKSIATNDRLRYYGNIHRSQGCWPGPQGLLIFCKHKDASTYQKARRSCKRQLDYTENTKCYKRLLVKNDRGSDQSIDKSSFFALLLVMRQSRVIFISKLCRLESRLSRPSRVLKMVINKVRCNGHPLVLHAINKQRPIPQYSTRLVKQRFK